MERQKLSLATLGRCEQMKQLCRGLDPECLTFYYCLYTDCLESEYKNGRALVATQFAAYLTSQQTGASKDPQENKITAVAAGDLSCGDWSVMEPTTSVLDYSMPEEPGTGNAPRPGISTARGNDDSKRHAACDECRKFFEFKSHKSITS